VLCFGRVYCWLEGMRGRGVMIALPRLLRCTVGFRNGSIGDTNRRDRHGRTCFDTGHQGTQPLCRFLIDEMTVSTIGKHRARTTAESCRHGGRGWILRWATSRHMQHSKFGRAQISLSEGTISDLRRLPKAARYASDCFRLAQHFRGVRHRARRATHHWDMPAVN
jgi:hypothetical protein